MNCSKPLEKEQAAFVRQSLLQSFSWVKINDTVNSNFEAYEHRQIPEKEKCIKWATKLMEVTNNLHDVSLKFTRQLEFLFRTSDETGYKKLNERTTAAATYFISELDEKVLASLKIAHRRSRRFAKRK